MHATDDNVPYHRFKRSRKDLKKKSSDKFFTHNKIKKTFLKAQAFSLMLLVLAQLITSHRTCQALPKNSSLSYAYLKHLMAASCFLVTCNIGIRALILCATLTVELRTSKLKSQSTLQDRLLVLKVLIRRHQTKKPNKLMPMSNRMWCNRLKRQSKRRQITRRRSMRRQSTRRQSMRR